jgi:pentatricopeptide repeat protein
MLINDCLTDISAGLSTYLESDLHTKVYESFVNAYGKVGSVDEILSILDKDTLFKSKHND